MSLQDCVSPPQIEPLDVSLTVFGVTILAGQITNGSAQVPAIKASWLAVGPGNVIGVQFEFKPHTAGESKRTATQDINAASWITTDGIVTGAVYDVRWRAAGVSVFGSWSGWTTVTVSALLIAGGFVGQGALATLDQVTWATQVTGVGKPEDYATKSLVYRSVSAPSSPGVNDIWVQLDGAGNAIATWAFNGFVWINGADRTIYNTAAGIVGQGILATINTVVTSLIAAGATGAGSSYEVANGTIITPGNSTTDLTYVYSADNSTSRIQAVVYGEIGAPTSTDCGVTFAVKCDGVTIGNGAKWCPGSWGQEGVSVPFNHVPGAGSHTYTVTYTATSPGGNVQINRTVLTLQEAKR